ncbi:hypothetical protein JCM6882_009066 [Rhodosporidiobolus microsporus]
MSVSNPPPDEPTVIPPTPASAAAPTGTDTALRPPPPLPHAGAQPPPATPGTKPPSPPRMDSGVVLEEVLQQALTLGEGAGGAAAQGERELEQREKAAVARQPVAPSPHSSGARSVASAQSGFYPQRPSPSSGRGSFNTAWSSRSPNSRTSSGSNIHDFSSARSSFERRPSGYGPPASHSHSQLHLHVPPGMPVQGGVPSPYNYSPNQRTPSDVQYPLGAFYPSASFYYPQQQQGQGGEALYAQQPQQQYGPSPPAFIAYQPFTSPLPSPHPSQYSPASFPFSAGPVSQPQPQPVQGYPLYAQAATLGAPSPLGLGAGRRRSSDIVYDDAGNPVSPVEAANAVGAATYYYPHPPQQHQQQSQQVSPESLSPTTSTAAQPFLYPPPPPPPPPSQASHPQGAGVAYQPVYVFPPPPPPPPLPAGSYASPVQYPLQPHHQHQQQQHLSYPISSARAASPSNGGSKGVGTNGGSEATLVYPITHSTAGSSSVTASASGAEPPPPTHHHQQQQQPYPAHYYPQPVPPPGPPPPPPPTSHQVPFLASPLPPSVPYTPSASAPLPQPQSQGQAQGQPHIGSPAAMGFAAHSRETSASTAGTGAGAGAASGETGAPRVYEVPTTPARGQLAQAGLRKAAAAGVSPPQVQHQHQHQQQQYQPRGSPQQVSPPGGRFGGGGGGGMGGRRDLPKPPAHSPFALWVGNVPSDASHAELWSFFQGRPVPSSTGVVAGEGEEGVDLDVTGIESIHLITRSNCAFVNYISSLHLRHAITVSNGLSLRPSDPRCKTFLCRERKVDDDFKSGVGAQRVGGMHRSYIREQRERMGEAQRVIRAQREAQGLGSGPGDGRREREESRESAFSGFSTSTGRGADDEHDLSPTSTSPQRAVVVGGAVATRRESVAEDDGAGGAQGGARRQSTVSSCFSVGSGTTTSTFLAKHFERRYFILKSHDEADLRLSVETGLWATQAHNEPVLQQAFRTAKTVYLIFGANGQGAWFGVARMAGPISTAASSSGGSRPSWPSSREGSSGGGGAVLSGGTSGGAGAASLSAPSQTIPEDDEALPDFPTRPPIVLADSDGRLAASSPLGISPSSAPPRTRPSESAPATLAPQHSVTGKVSPEARQAMSIEADLVARETADRLHLPAEVVARRAATLDEQKLGRRVQESGSLSLGASAGVSLMSGASGGEEAAGARKMVLESEAEKRNLRLESMEDKTEEPKPAAAPLTSAAGGRFGSANWGTPFAVEWVTVRNLPFARTKHIRNSFNGNREIKISRDGTEVEPSAGEALLSVFWADDADSSPSSSGGVDKSPSSLRSPAEAGARASGMVGGAVTVEGVEKV